MTNPLFGNWKLMKNENFDEYMSAVGVGWVLRKAGAAASSSTRLSAEGKGGVMVSGSGLIQIME